jgi:hypothetical protein
LYGHERSLVRRYQGEPFALLGINADPSPEVLRQVQQEKQLPWRSWWDGPGGPIAGRWGVAGWPTLILLDHRGVIRHRFDGPVSADELDQAIAGLLQEARPGGRG